MNDDIRDFVVTHRFAFKGRTPEEAAKNARAALLLNPQAMFMCTVVSFDTTDSALAWCASRQEDGDVFECDAQGNVRRKED